MSHSSVGATTAKKDQPAERQTIKVGYRLHIFIESNVNPLVQLQLRNTVRTIATARTTGFGNTSVNDGSWCYTQTKNDKAQEIPSNYQIKEDELSSTISIYEGNQHFANSLNRLISTGKQKILGQLIRQDIEDLQVHIFLYGINIGDALSHLYSSWGDLDYIQRSEQISHLLFDNDITDDRISYCKIDYIGFFDQATVTTISGNESAIENDRNKPTLNDIYDAIDLCQYTYELQSPLEYSVPNAVTKKLKSIFQPEKRKQEELQEQADRDKFRDRTEALGWHIATDDVLESLNMKGRLVNPASGFYSRLFVKQDVNRGQMYAYCTCGTNMSSVQDWISTNILQGLTGLSAQYTLSVQNAQRLDKAIGGKGILLFIGHSLGGGLASNNAIVTKSRYAITFNAAGLNGYRLAVTGNATLGRQITALFHAEANIKRNVLAAQNRVYAFVYDDEFLNKVLGPIGLGALGKKIKLVASADVSSFGKHSLINYVENAELRQAIANQYK